MTFALSPAPRGTVYGTLLNHRDALEALGGAVNEPPYKAPPRGPILYIKPRNTWVDDGGAVVMPPGIEALEIGATIGLVIGRPACRVRPTDAPGVVAGLVIVTDVSIPHASCYRPSLRFKARDTFCPIGPFVALGSHASIASLASIDTLAIAVAFDGQVVHRSRMLGLVRSPSQLIADVTEFMTLAPGDILCLGVAAGAPRAKVGQRVAVAVEGLGALENTIVPERATP